MTYERLEACKLLILVSEEIRHVQGPSGRLKETPWRFIPLPLRGTEVTRPCEEEGEVQYHPGMRTAQLDYC